MGPWSVLAALLAAAAVLVARPPASWSVAHRLGLRQEQMPTTVPRRLRLVVLVTAGASAVWFSGALAPAIAVATGVAVAVFGLGRWRAARARAHVQRTRREIGTALDLLGADLRAGVLTSRAVVAMAAGAPTLHGLALAPGGDDREVPTALRRAARRPGAEAWAALAAGWEVADRAGAPLADVVERLAETVRDDVDLMREVGAEAAPARATGQVMAVLPLLGLGLGAGMGADPFHLLTRTVPGALCLAAGALLACLGTWWVDRIASSAEAQV
ncbi:hypothetical protein GCM10009821_22590 [Aeromicrobium halocynthiae]|uniref:Type II secretion system protein GspF domain-containing protein n=1 Tax=Aeromicrobium halocynthiae TaxID=560557 RepID=A0ABN2W2B9_9ACTN